MIEILRKKSIFPIPEQKLLRHLMENALRLFSATKFIFSLRCETQSPIVVPYAIKKFDFSLENPVKLVTGFKSCHHICWIFTFVVVRSIFKLDVCPHGTSFFINNLAKNLLLTCLHEFLRLFQQILELLIILLFCLFSYPPAVVQYLL